MGSLLLTGVLGAMQVAQAMVLGTVSDGESGRALAEAVVTLSDFGRAALTDQEGRYLFREVPAGPQHLTVRTLGYAERNLHALVPRKGTLEINVSLRPEPILLDAIEVRPPIPLRGVENPASPPSPDPWLTLAAVAHHPLLAEPDVFQALAGGGVVVMPESPSGVHVRGGASDHTAYVLDGVPVFSPYHAAGIFSAWNPDALSQLQLASTGSSPLHPEALSGTVSGVTRTPGARFSARGSVGTSQVRATLDGPLGAGRAGYLLSFRSGFPGVLAPKDEPSYLRGETGDALAKLEAALWGGRLRLLGYESRNEIDAAALAEGEAPEASRPRNDFEWWSRSTGAAWARDLTDLALRIEAWRASGDATSNWHAGDHQARMSAERRDEGLLVLVEQGGPARRSAAGVRLQRSRTWYGVSTDFPEGEDWAPAASNLVGTAFLEHTVPLGRRLSAELAGSVAAAVGDVHLGPRAQLRWNPSDQLTVIGSYARAHQYAQSLRNPESVVGNIFPVDLHLGAGANVPVARSDQAILAADLRPLPGVRLSAQAYRKSLEGLVLVAPAEGKPFATGDLPIGSGEAAGLSLDLAAAGTRYGLIANYGWQRVRLDSGETTYVPLHGSRHLLDAGVVVFPTATSQLRVGAAGVWGRRATALGGSFEWEACNLLDQGCEFAGSPDHAGEPLGRTVLPPYLRVDVGLRKHWHLEVRGRDALIALFGSVTNVLARRNVLTYARDALSGERVEVEMRPPAPLVIGLDWRF